VHPSDLAGGFSNLDMTFTALAPPLLQSLQLHIQLWLRLNWNRWSTSLYVIYSRLRCGQRGSTCTRHITLDWIGLCRISTRHLTW